MTLIGLLTLGIQHSPAQDRAAESPGSEAQLGLEQTVHARAESVYRWTHQGADAYLLQGRCRLQSPDGSLSCDELLVLVNVARDDAGNRSWVVRAAASGRLETITEGRTSRLNRPVHTAQWALDREPTIDAIRFLGPPAEPSPLLPLLSVSPEVQQVQYELLPPRSAPGGAAAEAIPSPLPQPPGQVPRVRSLQPPGELVPADEPMLPAPPPEGEGRFQLILAGGAHSVEIVSRGVHTPTQIETQNRPESDETVVIARGGVTVLVRDVQAQLATGELLELGTISLSADQVVGWLPIATGLFSGTSSLDQAEGEFYLDGNIVFRQGDRVIYADRMYYNVSRQYGIVLGAEAITPVPDFEGVVRLKADVLQQVASGEFIAFDAAVTSSRMGVPRYWLQSEQLRFSDQTRPGVEVATGRPVEINDRVISSTNNFVYVGGFPILYWPAFSSDVTVSSFYLNSISIKRDRIFGEQVYLDFDVFQLLGVERPPQGTQWILSTDYLSRRGPALGTTLTYDRDSFFGVPGHTSGFLDAWGIRDSGLDILGRGRRDLVPETRNRGRVLGRHRQRLAYDYELIAEVGYLSDRNFLDQYFEQEWDQDKDHDTGIRARKFYLNHMFDLSLEARVNPFFMDTQRLPRLEHYMLGSSLLGDRLTWSMKNQVGYADLNVARPPTDPAIAAVTQTPLPGEVDAQGIIAATKQEVALPLETGPIKFVPFVSGEASHYGQDVDGDSLTRLIGQAGVRASLPMWRLDPNVQSSLLNVRGLAHKVELTGEYFYADSNTDFDRLPLYDRLDDNAQEEFRRRFIFTNYGGVLPDRYDPRTYALRQGMQRLVTNPAEVIADDLMQARLGVHQRWQTKRGLPGRERIVDLMRLDFDTMFFPHADRDNFGEPVGPTTYDFRYHAGDRVTLLSDGYIDFFDGGLRSLSAGVRTSRPGLGDVYVGVMSLEGPITSQVLRSSYNYRMNEKWIVMAMNTYDFGSAGNVGQTMGLTRIGESFLVRLGLDVDRGRDNVGFSFMVEPRFFPSRRIGTLGGRLIPAAGLEGLE